MTLWTINGEPFHPDRIDADPTLGAVELWKVPAQNVEHPIHIHLAPFQVVSVGGNDPGPWNQGCKDTPKHTIGASIRGRVQAAGDLQ
jgi:spore coat protein A, manganese oxidase